MGTSGIQSIAHFLYHLDNSWSITSINNPNVPILGIGESTNPSFIFAMERGADLNVHDELHSNNLNATLKLGTYYEEWRKESFINPLLGAGAALHIDTFQLKEWAIPRFRKKWGERFQELEGDVKSLINLPDKVVVDIDGFNHEFDYVIDCRGFPKNDDNYVYVDNPTNHCLVHNIPVGSSYDHTKHIATQDGWMFVVPLKTRTSYGYLFNNNITDLQTAKKNFSERINVPIEKLNNIEYSFKSYYTTNFINGRIVKNGNRAVFFEPMFANSLWMYDAANRILFDYIKGKCTKEEANQNFIKTSKNIEDFICFFYHKGSLYDTPFWKYAIKHSNEMLKNSTKLKELKTANEYFKNISREIEFNWGFDLPSIQIIDKNMEFNYL